MDRRSLGGFSLSFAFSSTNERNDMGTESRGSSNSGATELPQCSYMMGRGTVR